MVIRRARATAPINRARWPLAEAGGACWLARALRLVAITPKVPDLALNTRDATLFAVSGLTAASSSVGYWLICTFSRSRSKAGPDKAAGP